MIRTSLSFPGLVRITLLPALLLRHVDAALDCEEAQGHGEYAPEVYRSALTKLGKVSLGERA